MGTLTYRKDRHLEFLSGLDNKELEVLVDIITKDKDGDIRESEDLTLQDRYKKYNPNHQKYWDLIAADYQYFGGNTFISIFRGNGVVYEEILSDVCEKMKVNLPKNPSVSVMEQNLLMKTIEKSVEEMSPKQRKELLQEMDIKTQDFSKQAVIAALQAGINMGGFFVYQIAVVVANAVAKVVIGNGLAFAANAALARYIAIFAGPIGWIITGAWTAVDVAGPAYRITIPATIYIAALRQVEQNKQAFELKCPNCGTNIKMNSAKFCPECGAVL